MCAVSFIGDGFQKQWPFNPNNPWKDNNPANPFGVGPHQTTPFLSVSRQEFNALKKEVEELQKLLAAAKQYDEATGQPDCEMDDKVAFIKKIAEFVGVDLSSIFEPHPSQ